MAVPAELGPRLLAIPWSTGFERRGASKQMHDKQHGKAKGTISGQASVRTTQHNMADKTCSVILNHHDVVGENSGKLHG